ncbi:NAD(P)-dependent oxidoreductase [Bordetella sp. N]|uniref:NAD(P)-dependent oxidoreductase n=1 Tax=Bordetella sp. N TaxID=1746199 RepID=UPI00070F3122|nr:NAD(P)-dependent oxidoreductase [Bordetella sp. N]ALM84231.1 hypothetical protein ASB57_15745 [Bordetella sp. N]
MLKDDGDSASLADLAEAISTAVLVANFEILAVALKANLPLPRIADLINQSTGRSHVSAVELPKLIRNEGTSKLDIRGMLAGTERVLTSATAARLSLPIMAYAKSTLAAALNMEPASNRVGDLAQVFARFAGATMQASNDASSTPADNARDQNFVLGYVGLGVMGSALACRALGVASEVYVHDTRPESVALLVAQGARQAHSLTDMARRCDIILLCVPGVKEVRAVIFGDDGLYAGLKPGTMIIDQTTGSPADTRELARLLRERGVALVDAPIAGGPAGVEGGNFLSLSGGDAHATRTFRSLIQAMGSQVIDFGDAGNGHTAKLVKNALAISNRFIAYEGLSWASRRGLGMRAVCDAVASGLGDTQALSRLSAAAQTGKPTATITLALLAKDQQLICALGTDLGAPMGVANQVRAGVARATAELGETANIDEIGRLFGL